MSKVTKKPICKVILILITIVSLGTIGYTLIEGWSLFDSLYMTVITITTTGYREVGELSKLGKVFSMIIMFLGIGVFFYTLNIIIPEIIERRREWWKNLLGNMEKHYIICGYGRTGMEVSKRLPKELTVIIDDDLNKVVAARETGLVAIHGDVTEEESLEMAGIRRAKALIACTDKDASNAFAIIIAKDLNPNIFTVAILRSPTGESKLRRAGVDVLFSPYEDMAKRVYMAIMNPNLMDLLEIASKKGTFFLRKLRLANSGFSGRSIEELDLRRKTGCFIIAIERNEELLFPDPKTILQDGDILYIMGKEEGLCRLELSMPSL